MPKTRQIFINVPSRDIKKSTEFYQALGFTKNEMFSDEKASCMVWGDNIYLMVLSANFFASFIDGKEVIDATKTAGVTLCVPMSSRAEVDEFATTAVANGGRAFESENAAAESSMYSVSVEDPDGHIWEPLYMDMGENNA